MNTLIEPVIPAASVTILFLGANPSDTTRLALDREVREIDQRLHASKHRDAFRIEQAWAVRATDLQACLLRHRPGIVHFSGHGNSAGELLFEDETGTTRPVTPIALGNLFRVLRKEVRCVVLNACFSETQARAIAKHVDCVIGMTTAVNDSAAIAFAGAFYQALGFGEDVQTAFNLGCNQMELLARTQGGPRVPRLLIRRGVSTLDIRFAKGTHDLHTLSSKPQESEEGRNRLQPDSSPFPGTPTDPAVLTVIEDPSRARMR
ncbi:CHAT domain-containing protein [Sorangium sp. So ce388]|uniref:CHAT domain-containing protein n=1 Tax=Sorangium sp. So ce388 TaxID=3133309 RepID=UPI003F5B25E3